MQSDMCSTHKTFARHWVAPHKRNSSRITGPANDSKVVMIDPTHKNCLVSVSHQIEANQSDFLIR